MSQKSLQEIDAILQDAVQQSFFEAIEIHDFQSALTTRKALAALQSGDFDAADSAFDDWEAEPERRKATQSGSSDPAPLSAASPSDTPAGQRALPMEGR